MMRRLSLLFALALCVTALAVPVAADEGDDPVDPADPPEVVDCRDVETGELVLAESQVWLTDGGTKAGNLGAIGATDFPTWDEEAPEASVTEGAGGGYLVNSSNFVLESDETLFGLTVEGPQSGCLDSMVLELYAATPTNRTGTSGDLEEANFTAIVSLAVDGLLVMFPTEVDTLTDENPQGDATMRIRVAISGIHEALEFEGMDLDADRELRLNVSPRFINTDNAIFFWDTVEVPSTIIFNGEADEDVPVVPAF